MSTPNGKAQRPWPKAEVHKLISLKAAQIEPDWDEIADHFPGRTAAQCQSRFKYEGRAVVGSRVNEHHAKTKTTPEQEAERDARLTGYGKRSFSQALFGDPPIGMSALDEKRRQSA